MLWQRPLGFQWPLQEEWRELKTPCHTLEAGSSFPAGENRQIWDKDDDGGLFFLTPISFLLVPFGRLAQLEVPSVRLRRPTAPTPRRRFGGRLRLSAGRRVGGMRQRRLSATAAARFKRSG